MKKLILIIPALFIILLLTIYYKYVKYDNNFDAVTNDKLKVIKSQKELIDTYLSDILSNPVNCDGLVDDEIAFNELKRIEKIAESPGNFIDFWNREFIIKMINDQAISYKIEQEIQNKSHWDHFLKH